MTSSFAIAREGWKLASVARPPFLRLAAAFAILLGTLALGQAIAQEPPRPVFQTPAERASAREKVDRLAAIQSRHERGLLERAGVFGVGIGFEEELNEFVFVVYVDEAGPTPPLPNEIEGVSIVVRREKPPRVQHGAPFCTTPCHANQLPLPVQMGNSGAIVPEPCWLCTMGFKACDVEAHVRVWVTASHCAPDTKQCPGGAPIGTRTQHVSPRDAGCGPTSIVGTVLKHAVPGVGQNVVDATSVSSRDDQTQWSIRDIGIPSTQPGAALPLDPVQKSGRTTGYSFGPVIAVNLSVRPSYLCVPVLMAQQINFVSACEDGDSGSAVLNFAEPPRIVGLLIAGETGSCWANEIGNVLTELNLSLDPDDCPDCAAEEAAKASQDPSTSLELLYALRDDVLSQSGYGREVIQTFSAVTPAWVGLYVRHPRLLATTARALDANVDVINAIVEGRELQVPRRRLRDLDRLIEEHIELTDDPELRAVFERYHSDLRNESIQRQFGVHVGE